jgi:hypothetical protein
MGLCHTYPRFVDELFVVKAARVGRPLVDMIVFE